MKILTVKYYPLLEITWRFYYYTLIYQSLFVRLLACSSLRWWVPMFLHRVSLLEVCMSKRKDKDVIEQVRRWKWTWAWHVSRIRDNQWTLRITIWKPYKRKRPRGRPARCWRDKLDDYWKGTIWQRIVQDRQMWKQHAEAFAQQWWWWFINTLKQLNIVTLTTCCYSTNVSSL